MCTHTPHLKACTPVSMHGLREGPRGRPALLHTGSSLTKDSTRLPPTPQRQRGQALPALHLHPQERDSCCNLKEG